jgi:hypothetical protein
MQHRVQRAANGCLRLVMAQGLSRLLGQVTVNEFPKSGGTWLGQMLSSALGLPFPRNAWPRFGPSILHGHYIHPFGMKRVVIVWRDGRDVMVSWYHHCLFENEIGNAGLVKTTRREVGFVDFENVKSNLPRFIEYSFKAQRQPGFSWADFIRRWHGRRGVVYTRYEDLRQDTVGELRRIGEVLSGRTISEDKARSVAEEFSFARQSGRKPGAEIKGSFMRKGMVGDWKNVFNAEARELFCELAGDALILAGYEKDDGWAKTWPKA